MQSRCTPPLFTARSARPTRKDAVKALGYFLYVFDDWIQDTQSYCYYLTVRNPHTDRRVAHCFKPASNENFLDRLLNDIVDGLFSRKPSRICDAEWTCFMCFLERLITTFGTAPDIPNLRPSQVRRYSRAIHRLCDVFFPGEPHVVMKLLEANERIVNQQVCERPFGSV